MKSEPPTTPGRIDELYGALAVLATDATQDFLLESVLDAV